MKQIGSQRRESISESGYKLYAIGGDFAILETKDGKLELWYPNNDFAGYVIDIGGIGYEFARDYQEAE